MKISDLTTFVEIVEAGGLTAAAERRGVSQPAFSRALRDLEARMQAQLLRRTGRGIEVTPAGEDFLRFAIETLERFAQTQRRVAAHGRTLPKELNLSVPLRLGRLMMLDLYRAFSERLTETNVHIFEEASDRARTLVLEGQLDAAITYRNISGTNRNFVPLVSESLYAVGNKGILGVDRAPICSEDLCELPLLLPSQGPFRELVNTALRSQGQPVPVVRELETAEGLLAFAAEGEGVAILPMSNVYQEVARGDLTARVISDPAMTRIVGLQLGAGLSKFTADQVLKVIRRVFRQVACLAEWKKLTKEDGAAAKFRA